MPATHPHADAAYATVPHKDGGYAVEVLIPNSSPTIVSGFATAAAANAWAARHKLGTQRAIREGKVKLSTRGRSRKL